MTGSVTCCICNINFSPSSLNVAHFLMVYISFISWWCLSVFRSLLRQCLYNESQWWWIFLHPKILMSLCFIWKAVNFGKKLKVLLKVWHPLQNLLICLSKNASRTYQAKVSNSSKLLIIFLHCGYFILKPTDAMLSSSFCTSLFWSPLTFLLWLCPLTIRLGCQISERTPKNVLL